VIIAVVAVRMVKPPVNEIVDMVAVRDGLMPAARTMAVCAAARVLSAAVRVLIADLDNVLVMPSMRMVQAAILKIIDVVSVADRGMSTVRPMLMSGGFCHELISLARCLPCGSHERLYPHSLPLK
jgi:hypothetical protein